MILVGIAAEWGAGIPLHRLIPQLELGFGGPLAGAGFLGSNFSLPVHYLHGLILGLLLAGILWVGERWRLAPQGPVWTSGLIFGAVVSVVVLGLLAGTSNTPLSPGLIGLVVLLHLTFGGLAGALIQRVRQEPGLAPAAGAPMPELRSSGP